MAGIPKRGCGALFSLLSIHMINNNNSNNDNNNNSNNSKNDSNGESIIIVSFRNCHIYLFPYFSVCQENVFLLCVCRN